MTKSPDLYKMPHFHAPNRPYMSNRDRAAQFAPFKSLNVASIYKVDEQEEPPHFDATS